MINNNFKKAIKIVHQLLKDNNIKWALIGSTNLALQGMNINPNDLDIIVKMDDLKLITKIFSEYNSSEAREIKSMTSEPIWEIKAKIDNIEVHIISEKETGEYLRKFLLNNMIEIKLDNINIPCFTLEAEAKAYSETNRENKSQIIKEFLKGSS